MSGLVCEPNQVYIRLQKEKTAMKNFIAVLRIEIY